MDWNGSDVPKDGIMLKSKGLSCPVDVCEQALDILYLNPKYQAHVDWDESLVFSFKSKIRYSSDESVCENGRRF